MPEQVAAATFARDRTRRVWRPIRTGAAVAVVSASATTFLSNRCVSLIRRGALLFPIIALNAQLCVFPSMCAQGDVLTFVTGGGPVLTPSGPTSGSPSYVYRGDATAGVMPTPSNLLVWAQGGALGIGSDPGVPGTVPTGAGGCYGTTSTATYGVQVSSLAPGEQLVGFCGGNGADKLGGGGGAGGYCSAGGNGGAGCYGQANPCAQAVNGQSAPGQGGCGGGGGSNSNAFNVNSATTTIGGGGGIGILPPSASGFVPAGYACKVSQFGISPGGPNEPTFPSTPKGWRQDLASCGTGGAASPQPFNTVNPTCANPTLPVPCIGNGYTAASGIGGFGQPGASC